MHPELDPVFISYAYHMIPSDLASGKIPMEELTVSKRLRSTSAALVPWAQVASSKPCGGALLSAGRLSHAVLETSLLHGVSALHQAQGKK